MMGGVFLHLIPEAVSSADNISVIKYVLISFIFFLFLEHFINWHHCAYNSKKVSNYRLLPEMSAKEITQKTIRALAKQDYYFILVNYANADMVGHTGDRLAGKIAVETIDEQLSILVDTAIQNNYSVVITADHGNIEEMLNPQTGELQTSHSKNEVPLIIIDNQLRGKITLNNGILADVAPTILKIMDLKKPAEMTGKELF